MAHLGTLDLPERLGPTLPAWLTQIGVGLVASAAAGVVRLAVDFVAPGGAPFALIFPAILLATLFGRWFAGAVSATSGILFAWFYLFPIKYSFRFADEGGMLAIISVTVAAVITIAIAEVFRATARAATDARDREIADRDLFLAEFDHRMKNNFAIVAGLLDMQRRRAPDAGTAEALATAQARVDSIARAHRHLYRDPGQPHLVEMRDYLKDLSTALADALFLRGGIRLACEADAAALPRDRAVSIGLVVNELVTNAAKHAFPDRDLGTIEITFRARDKGGWRLVVADDGVGLPETATPADGHGLGSRLSEAFARQAGGTLMVDSDRTGTRVTMDVAA